MDVRYLLFAGIQHSPVSGCSAVSCNFGVLAGEDDCTSFCSATPFYSLLLASWSLLLRLVSARVPRLWPAREAAEKHWAELAGAGSRAPGEQGSGLDQRRCWGGPRRARRPSRAPPPTPSPSKMSSFRVWMKPGWMKHKLGSRLLGEISVTSAMQMTPPFWQKVKRN